MKRDEIQGLLSILSLFHSELNSFNNTRARKLYYICHMAHNDFERASECDQAEANYDNREMTSRDNKSEAAISLFRRGMIAKLERTQITAHFNIYEHDKSNICYIKSKKCFYFSSF